MTPNKTTEETYHVKTYSKHVAEFAEDHENCTSGLGYMITLKMTTNNDILSRRVGTKDHGKLVLAGRGFINDTSW